MTIPSLFRRWRRKLRWLAGRGWSAADFEERYAAHGADAWGYRESDQHRRRAEWILGALPKAHFASALEVGCAQGFLSERLAAHVDRLIACDISADAVGQARDNCRSLPQIQFCVADIRDGFPGDAFDLCLFSDVLYYLSPRETDAVLAEGAQKTRAGGFLLIANEWSGRARGLTPPTYSFARLDASALWERSRLLTTRLDETELSLAIYRRLPSAAAQPRL